jgi:hypothetical protein
MTPRRFPPLTGRCSLGAHRVVQIDLVARGHHQGSFARLVHAAEPAGEKWLAWQLFIDAVILPDLHRLAAARTRIAVAGDDETLLSLPFSAQIAPPMKIRTPTRCERSPDQAIWKWELVFGWHVTVCRHVAVDFETDANFNQNGHRPSHGVLLLDRGK